MATNKIITVTVIPTLSGDTIASYNAYSDIDGLLGAMTPAEGLAGKIFSLSDGVIHDITVKVVWTTAGETTTVGSNVVTVDLSVVEQWDISLATYDSISTDVSAQIGTSVVGLSVNTPKTKMFLTSNTNKTVYQYTINANGTLTYDSVSLDLSGLGSTLLSSAIISNDGRHLVAATNQTTFAIFDIAIGDVHTIENLSITPSRTVTGLNGDTINSISLSTDDSLIFLSNSSAQIRKASIDLVAGTIIDLSDTFSVPISTTYSIFFGDSGNVLYVADQNNDEIRQYALTAPYTLAAATVGTPLDLTGWTAALRASWTDGFKMYAVDTTDQVVRRYSM